MAFDDFTRFEHAGWERTADVYQATFGDVTRQSSGALLDALGVGAGTRFLDVATGPGYVAGLAAQRGAQALGVDFAQAMIDAATHAYPDAAFRLGSADALPFDNDSFDAVGISFGILHFADPDKALAEAWRVLRRGGKIAFTAWAVPERAVGFGMTLNALKTYGKMDVPLPPGPPFERFSEWNECKRTLLEVGFSEPHVAEVSQMLHTRAPETVFHMLLGGVRMAALLRAQTPQALVSIEQSILQQCAPYRTGDDIRVPMPCVLACAKKP